MIYSKKTGLYKGKSKLEALFEKYAHLMFTIANEILNDKYLSEDVVQESFIKINNNMDKIGAIDSLETKNFIVIVVKNTALDVYRKRKKDIIKEVCVDEIEETVFCDSFENLDIDLNMDTENRVLTIIKNMKDIYKDVFLLKYVNNLSNEEISKTLNISDETIRKRLSRGKDIIEKQLKGKEENNE